MGSTPETKLIMASKKTTSSRRTSSASKKASSTPAKPTFSTPRPRDEKPVISATTWITLLVLVVVAGFAYLFNQQKAKQQAAATPTPGTAMLFTSAEGQPSDIKIESSTGTSVEVARNDKGVWVLKAPTQADADQAAAEAAATQIGALQVVGDVQLGLDIVGLDKPADTITLTFTGGKTHKLAVGSVNPIQTGYYVQLDGGKTQIVDKPGLDAILSMLTKPPYVATATPSVTDTPTATATPETTPTATEGTPTVVVTGTATKSP